MKIHVNCKLFIKILLTGFLIFCVTVSATGQSYDQVRDAVRKATETSEFRNANNSLLEHVNNRCSSGRVYVIKVYDGRGTLIITSYYCENERSEFNSVYSFVNNLARGNALILKTEIIDGSTTVQPNTEEIEAEKQRQAEIEKQREIERLEERRKFEEGKQELIAGLAGMAQEVTRPLELMGGVQTSTNSLELIGMEQKSGNTLELIEINPPSTPAPPKGIYLDDTKGLPVVDYRPSGIIMPETKLSINANTMRSGSIQQISESKEIKYEHPYIDLTIGTATAIASLSLKTGTGILLGLSVNIWKENGKALYDYYKYGKIPSTKEILYNAFWDDGKVPAAILGEVVTAGIMKKGSGYLIKNAEKFGVEPYVSKVEDVTNATTTGWGIGSDWTKQITEDYSKSQQNKNK